MRYLVTITILTIITSCKLDPQFATRLIPEQEVIMSGCTVEQADNYNEDAEVDNGTCYFRACFDESQDNFSDRYYHIIDHYIKQHGLEKEQVVIHNCSGRSGCEEPAAYNFDPEATIENGTCTFKACLDDDYLEYQKMVAVRIIHYLDQHGETHNGSYRLDSTCSTRAQFCAHPRANNYTPGKTRGDEFCRFTACDLANFEGYADYLEFSDYLSTRQGEIEIDRSAQTCGARLMDRNTKYIEIQKTQEGAPLRLSIVLDNSTSMADEWSSVKQGLKQLPFILQDYPGEIDLEIFNMRDVNTGTHDTFLRSNGGVRVYRVDYHTPVADFEKRITSQTNGSELYQQIDNFLEGFALDHEFRLEQGMCYTKRLVERFAQSSDHNLIHMIITDEDDHWGGSSVHCNEYAIKHTSSVMPLPYFENFPYRDKHGQWDLVNVTVEDLKELPVEKKFHYINIMYDQDENTCVSKIGNQHGATYIRFMNQLQNHGMSYVKSDVCESDYGSLVESKLGGKIKEVLGLRYKVSRLSLDPEFQKLFVVKGSGDEVELIKDQDFVLVEDGEFLFIEMQEHNKELLSSAQELKVVIYEGR